MPHLSKDDPRFWFCPRCGHRWESRTTHIGQRRRRCQWLGCALVAVALLGFTLCVLSIVGWL